MNKKIFLILLIICILILSGYFLNKNLSDESKQLNTIFYLTNKNNASQKVRFTNNENQERTVKIDSGPEIPANIVKKADVLWVDFEYLNENKNFISNINEAIDLKIPVIVIGDQLERHKIIALLNLAAEESDSKNTGDAILKGIKIDKTSKKYFFTNIYIGKEESKDEKEVYSGLASASYSSN